MPYMMYNAFSVLLMFCFRYIMFSVMTLESLFVYVLLSCFCFCPRVRWKRRSMKDRLQSNLCPSVWLTNIKLRDIFQLMTCVSCTSSSQIDWTIRIERNVQHQSCQRCASRFHLASTTVEALIFLTHALTRWITHHYIADIYWIISRSWLEW